MRAQILGDLRRGHHQDRAAGGRLPRATPARRTEPRHGRACSWGSTAASAASCSISRRAAARDGAAAAGRSAPTCSCTASARRSSQPLGIGPDTLMRAQSRGWSTPACTASREDGPYRGRPAYDDIIQGLSGCASADGAADRRAAATSPTIALPTRPAASSRRRPSSPRSFRREQHRARAAIVEVPMFETMVAFNMVEHLLRPALRVRRWPSRAIRACWRRGGGRTARPTATSARWPTPTRTGSASSPRPACRSSRGDPRFATITERTKNIEALYETGGESHRARGARRAGSIRSRQLEIPAARMNRARGPA